MFLFIDYSLSKQKTDSKQLIYRALSNWESVEVSVIQATGTVEFEEGLRTAGAYSGSATLESDMARPWRPASTQV